MIDNLNSLNVSILQDQYITENRPIYTKFFSYNTINYYLHTIVY